MVFVYWLVGYLFYCLVYGVGNDYGVYQGNDEDQWESGNVKGGQVGDGDQCGVGIDYIDFIMGKVDYVDDVVNYCVIDGDQGIGVFDCQFINELLEEIQEVLYCCEILKVCFFCFCIFILG